MAEDVKHTEPDEVQEEVKPEEPVKLVRTSPGLAVIQASNDRFKKANDFDNIPESTVDEPDEPDPQPDSGPEFLDKLDYQANKSQHEMPLWAGMTVEKGSEAEKQLKNMAAGYHASYIDPQTDKTVEAINEGMEKVADRIVESREEPTDNPYDGMPFFDEDLPDLEALVEGLGEREAQALINIASRTRNITVQQMKELEGYRDELKGTQGSIQENAAEKELVSRLYTLHRKDPDNIPDPRNNLNDSMAALESHAFLGWLNDFKQGMGIPQEQYVDLGKAFDMYTSQTGKQTNKQVTNNQQVPPSQKVLEDIKNLTGGDGNSSVGHEPDFNAFDKANVNQKKQMFRQPDGWLYWNRYCEQTGQLSGRVRSQQELEKRL